MTICMMQFKQCTEENLYLQMTLNFFKCIDLNFYINKGEKDETIKSKLSRRETKSGSNEIKQI